MPQPEGSPATVEVVPRPFGPEMDLGVEEGTQGGPEGRNESNRPGWSQ